MHWATLLLVSCCAVLAQELVCHLPAGADRRPNKHRLKIVQFNVYWLFLNDWQTGIAPDGPWKSKSDAEAHAAVIARQLDELDADIYHLTEVEDCETLGLVRQKMRNGAQYRVFFTQGGDSVTGQDVILLSRVDPVARVARTDERANFPISGSQCGYTGESARTTASKNLIAKFDVENFPPFVLAGVHFIAQPTTPDRCAKREAQASLIVDAIQQELRIDQTLAIVVLGDMNDFDPDVADASSSKPNSRVLRMLKNAAASYGSQLKSTAEFVDQADRWTYCSGCSRPKCSQIDFLLASADLIALGRDVGHELRGRMPQCRQPDASDHHPVALDMFACTRGDAGCQCRDGDRCNGALQCVSVGCVHSDQCKTEVSGSSECPCSDNVVSGERRRAVRASDARQRALMLTGVIDGPLTGGTPKVGAAVAPALTWTQALEFMALADIADLSLYGVGVSNNGGGADGREWSFPNVTLNAGAFVYATDNSTSGRSEAGALYFEDFFGFEADFVMVSRAQSSGIAFNGDDSIELYFMDDIVDRFGFASYSNGATFNYEDGWAKRVNCSPLDPARFVKSHWNISAKAWDKSSETNEQAKSPFPLAGLDADCPTLTTTTETTTVATSAPTMPTSTTLPTKTATVTCLDGLSCVNNACTCVRGKKGCLCDDASKCDDGLQCVAAAGKKYCFLDPASASHSTVPYWLGLVVVCIALVQQHVY